MDFEETFASPITDPDIHIHEFKNALINGLPLSQISFDVINDSSVYRNLLKQLLLGHSDTANKKSSRDYDLYLLILVIVVFVLLF